MESAITSFNPPHFQQGPDAMLVIIFFQPFTFIFFLPFILSIQILSHFRQVRTSLLIALTLKIILGKVALSLFLKHKLESGELGAIMFRVIVSIFFCLRAFRNNIHPARNVCACEREGAGGEKDLDRIRVLFLSLHFTLVFQFVAYLG